MILNHILSILTVPPASHLLYICSLFILTYARILGKDYFWVIDDLDGLARYGEHWSPEKRDAAGNITEAERKVESYDCCDGDKKHKVKFLEFNPHLGFPGSILRFCRLHLGKKFKVIGTNAKGHEVWGYSQSPRRHHIFSMLAHLANLILGYFFLKPLVGENIAFGTCLLYAVHPLTTQTVGWISGVMYNLSLLGSLLALNAVLYIHDYHLLIPIIVACAGLSTLALYIGTFTWVILWFLGFKWAALAYGIVGTLIFFWKGNETKNYRVKAFKEQNMDKTTFLNWRKPIVMVKTFGYYLRHVFLPIRLGLYHVWGYFYEPPIEQMTPYFWLSLLALIGTVATFIYAPFAIKLGILWFFTYFILFSNFVTAMQFVADRYVTVPAFGICLILASVLGFSPIFWVILGLYAMRTFCHLPTFKNEIDFYLSNFLNFRKSEVALGNLGVAYMNQQMPGSSVDTWFLSTKINPHYDVSWYNLYSMFKANGRLGEAKTFLENCLKAKVVHFQKRWEEELAQLNTQITTQNQPPQVPEAVKLYQEARFHYEKGDIIKEEEVIRKVLEMPSNQVMPDIHAGLNQRLQEIVKAKS